MKKIYILFILSLCDPFAFGQQSAMLEKYRSMALEYSHDLKAAEKNLAASIELEKSARADLKPKLSGDANFQYTGNPLEINLNLPGMDNPLQIQWQSAIVADIVRSFATMRFRYRMMLNLYGFAQK